MSFWQSRIGGRFGAFLDHHYPDGGYVPFWKAAILHCAVNAIVALVIICIIWVAR